MLTQDPVGAAPALVDAVKKDVSTVAGIVAGGGTPPAPGVPGGGGLPGLGGVTTYVSQALDPVIAILKDPVRLVSATVQQPPLASTGLLGPVRTDRAGQRKPVVQTTSLRGFVARPRAAAAGCKRGRSRASRSGPSSGRSACTLLRRPPPERTSHRSGLRGQSHTFRNHRSRRHITGGDHERRRHLALDPLAAAPGCRLRQLFSRRPGGAPSPKLPGTPPQPERPALGGMSFSTLLSLGSFAALAVMLASIAARSGFIRRLALPRGRPVGFALLLERPG